ncbi:MAG: ATPase, partial [Ruminiclostridium sp.]
LNGEQVRVFDTKSLSVFELLGAAGFKTSQIMGHSGAGLKFTLNGETKIVKGTAFTPAVITVNGKPSALTTKIKQGDEITLVPAVNGENAHAFIRDYAKDISKVNVIFCGENAVAGKRAFANGKEVGTDYEIQPLDNIEIHDSRTLGAFLMQYGGDTQMAEVFVNGDSVPESYILKEGDIIGFEKAEKAPEPVLKPEANEETAESEPEDKGNYVSVIFNGVPTDLPEKESKTPYMLIDLFAMADIDIENTTKRLVLSINGSSAKFTDRIVSGDIVVVKQED